jgi:hypothetical protein
MGQQAAPDYDTFWISYAPCLTTVVTELCICGSFPLMNVASGM